MYRIALFLLAFVIGPTLSEAHTPILVESTAEEVVAVIDTPNISRAFYGELTGAPHTFEIVSEEPFTLFTQILVPDIEEAEDVISGIIVRLPEKEGRVTEIARLQKSSVSWESEYEFFGGDTYRNGPMFERELEAGTYRIEVNTPINEGKYVLVIGKEEVREIGYIESIRRIAKVKEFFNKSQLMVVQSPFVFVPILVLFGIILFIRKKLT